MRARLPEASAPNMATGGVGGIPTLLAFLLCFCFARDYTDDRYGARAGPSRLLDRQNGTSIIFIICVYFQGWVKFRCTQVH
jgi:hypothetical protein